MKLKTPPQFLCKKCLAKFREYDTLRKQRYLKSKVKRQLTANKQK